MKDKVISLILFFAVVALLLVTISISTDRAEQRDTIEIMSTRITALENDIQSGRMQLAEFDATDMMTPEPVTTSAPYVYPIDEIPTEFLEGVAIRLQEAETKGYNEGCIYAIDHITVSNDPDNPGMMYLNLSMNDGALERYGVPVKDFSENNPSE